MENTNKKKRLFIALNLPEEIKKELAEALFRLNREVGGTKWVKPNILHLNLHFLGYLNEEQEKKVKNIMAESKGKFGPLNFEVGELSAFPNILRPRVIFLDCRQINGNSVHRLQGDLGDKLAPAGFQVDARPWQAHLTLGRIKTKLPQSVQSLAKYIKIKNKQFSVDSFELMESHLSPSGAEYKEVVSYKL